MTVRSFIAFSVVIAIQALAGCGMPAKSGVARDDRPAWRNAEVDVRDARLRRQVEAGTFGLAQLFPGGMPVEARDLRPLPRPWAVAVVSLGVERPSPPETRVTPMQLAFATPAGQRDACVYKPVMSDADMDACR